MVTILMISRANPNFPNLPISETLIVNYLAFSPQSVPLPILRMQKSASTHAQFFTSLKHLEKRLKLENHPPPPSTLPQPLPPPPPPPPITIAEEPDSLGTPIYLNGNQSPNTSTNPQESEAPSEFLSRSPDFPPSLEVQERVDRHERFGLDDDIELLMQLLCLSDTEGETAGVNDVGCDDRFYDKIVGVKGPKSANEAERLELWIKYLSNGETKEPFRLAHLLMGKAAFVHSGDDGFGGLVFPSTIDEFLQNDPPAEPND